MFARLFSSKIHVDSCQPSHVASSRFWSMIEVFLIISSGLIKVFLSQIEVGQRFTVTVNQFVVALVFFHSLIKHLDSLFVLLVVLQCRTVVSVVETSELRAIRSIKQRIRILQCLGSTLHIGEVIKDQTIPSSFTWVAR